MSSEPLPFHDPLAICAEALERIAALEVGPEHGPWFGRYSPKAWSREEQVVGAAQVALLDAFPDRERLPEPKHPRPEER